MRRRIELVGEVSALNARALKLAQAASGIEMDILRLEQAIGRNPANGQLVQELHDAENDAGKMRGAQAACSKDIAAAERKVAALDDLIAAVKGA
ncbi:hypothetical protein AJ87_41795 [Rhizobium yanglingense]|nr:hypothetical protein AJ87_41795 [Rhizobium yanglingense]